VKSDSENEKHETEQEVRNQTNVSSPEFDIIQLEEPKTSTPKKRTFKRRHTPPTKKQNISPPKVQNHSKKQILHIRVVQELLKI
jgi:hypothetical protein